MCFLPKGAEERQFAIDAAGQKYKQTDKLSVFGGDLPRERQYGGGDSESDRSSLGVVPT